MKLLNNKGFTLVEVLAVVVILGVLSTILVSTVGYLLKQNEKDNYNNLKSSFLSATKVYMSDNRYNIKLADDSCDDNDYRSISKINDVSINDNKLFIKTLIDNKLLSIDKIKNPKDSNQILDNNNSYIIIKYSCNNKDYVYGCFDDDDSFADCANIGRSHLVWFNY